VEKVNEIMKTAAATAVFEFFWAEMLQRKAFTSTSAVLSTDA